MIVSNHLIEQQQIEIIPIPALDAKARLGVTQHRISEVSDEPAGKRRQSLDARRAVSGQHLAQYVKRFIRLYGAVLHALEFDRTVFAGCAQDRVIAEEGIPRPLLAALHAFEQEEPFRPRLQPPQQGDRRGHIRVNLAAHRNGRIFRREFYNFITAWGYHVLALRFRLVLRIGAIKKAFVLTMQPCIMGQKPKLLRCHPNWRRYAPAQQRANTRPPLVTAGYPSAILSGMPDFRPPSQVHSETSFAAALAPLGSSLGARFRSYLLLLCGLFYSVTQYMPSMIICQVISFRFFLSQ